MSANQAKPTPDIYVGGELYVKATSHQALLEAAQDVVRASGLYPYGSVDRSRAMDRLKQAISLAEKGQP